MEPKSAPLSLENQKRYFGIGGGLITVVFAAANLVGYCSTAQRLDEGLSIDAIEYGLQPDNSQSGMERLSLQLWRYSTRLGREAAYTWHH